MKRYFRISSYPGLVVFAIAGVSAVIFAFTTFNLFHVSMANLTFLREHGWVAITSGGLLQLLQIALSGTIALAAFLLFKVCETDLVIRYHRWQDR